MSPDMAEMTEATLLQQHQTQSPVGTIYGLPHPYLGRQLGGGGGGGGDAAAARRRCGQRLLTTAGNNHHSITTAQGGRCRCNTPY